jgi:NAD(P)H dehydrogenase (quinone)
MIAITGSTGHLGRLVIEDLLDRGVAPSELVATARSPENAADLADRGVEVREADYSKPDTLASAFKGVDHLLLISSSEVGQRAQQHRNVIDAADEHGVDVLAYTSMLRADTSPMQLASEHRATEEYIRESDLPFVLLRNGWYIENYTEQLGQALDRGAFIGSAGDGRISGATRADYAAAAATVLTTDGHEGAVYELGGDEAFTMNDLAEVVTELSGTNVVYRDLPAEEYEQALVEAGLPADFAAVLADSDQGIADGHLYTESDDLRRLIGRPTTPLKEAIAAALDARDG